MPTYQFKCQECGACGDWEMSRDEVEESPMLPCACGGVDEAGVGVETLHSRIYSFGLASVKGAGGSPGRFGKLGSSDG